MTYQDIVHALVRESHIESKSGRTHSRFG